MRTRVCAFVYENIWGPKTKIVFPLSHSDEKEEKKDSGTNINNFQNKHVQLTANKNVTLF